MLPSLDPVQGGMRNADPLPELGIRQASPCFSQVSRQLSIQISLHPENIGKNVITYV